ncbi:methionyl-tRNA synthetase, partial [Tulasnella sp. 427]
ANTFFTHAAPWASDDPLHIAETHVYAHQALHLAGILSLPLMPTKAAELLDRLGVPSEERTWARAQRVSNASVPEEGEAQARWTEVRTRHGGKPPTGPLFPQLS